MAQAHEGDQGWLGERDVFDFPNAPATEAFINPFACSISPLDWKTLQQVLLSSKPRFRPPSCSKTWSRSQSGHPGSRAICLSLCCDSQQAPQGVESCKCPGGLASELHL